jgi:hypothetical protein
VDDLTGVGAPARTVLAFAGCVDPASGRMELLPVSTAARAMVERDDPALHEALKHVMRTVGERPVFDDDTDPRPAPEGAALFSTMRAAFAEQLRALRPDCRVWCGALRR